jgi:hypothetical protein
MSDQPLPLPRIVWGVPAIAKAINRTERATYHMVERGTLPGARKVGGRWCFEPDKFFSTAKAVAAA